MHKRVALLVLYCLLTSIITSCYGARETDEMAYVLSIGVDRGVANTIRYSFQIPLMKGSSGGTSQGIGGSEGSDDTVFTVDAPSFFTAVNMINTTISRRLNFVHAKYIVFSEDAIKADFMKITIASLFRFREIRRSVKMIVVRGEAQEFLSEINPIIGSMLSKYQETLIEQSDETGYFPISRAYDVYNALKSHYEQPITILAGLNNYKNFKKEGEKWDKGPQAIPYFAGEVPRQGGYKIEFMGSVIFNGPKMVDMLNGFDTRILLMIRGQTQRLVFVSEDPLSPGKVLTIDMKERRKPKVNVSFDEGSPIIDLKVELEGDYLTIQSGIDYEKEENRKILEESIEKEIKTQIDTLTEKCISLDCDVFGFGYAAAVNFRTIQEFESYNWKTRFGDAKVNTQVDFKVKRPGTMIQSSPIITNEGESK